jgi:hypothetical protein
MKKTTRKAKTETVDDPVVQEVREARAKLWKEGGATFEGFLAAVRRHAAAVRKTRPTKSGRSG